MAEELNSKSADIISFPDHVRGRNGQTLHETLHRLHVQLDDLTGQLQSVNYLVPPDVLEGWAQQLKASFETITALKASIVGTGLQLPSHGGE